MSMDKKAGSYSGVTQKKSVPQAETEGQQESINFAGLSDADMYCVAQHLNTYYEQCRSGEIADWGKPCERCEKFLQRKCDWSKATLVCLKFCTGNGIAMKLNRTQS